LGAQPESICYLWSDQPIVAFDFNLEPCLALLLGGSVMSMYLVMGIWAIGIAFKRF
jgi:hypothetical protein